MKTMHKILCLLTATLTLLGLVAGCGATAAPGYRVKVVDPLGTP